MRALILAIGLALLAQGAEAADLPQYRPAPAWVKPIPIPQKPPSGGDQGVLLQVSQARFSDAGDEIYDERAFRIQDPGDLARYGNVVVPWSPETQTLVFHKLEVIRDGHAIDQLDQGRRVQVLHRETNLEKAMFDGTLTATVQLEGLQVGDVVHVAMTLVVHDPVLKGHSQQWSGLARPGKIGRVYLSASWPASKPLRWKATEGLAQPQTTLTKDGGSLVVDLTDAEAPLAPRGAPARFGALANVQMSDFASWSEVSGLMAPLFDKASTLEGGSPLKAEIARIKAQSSDPKLQAFAALKLVQDQIRYLFVGLNNGNLVPAAADETWRRRFGDCKAKTALLLALLHGLGIQAQPALVDTQTGDALPGRLPSLSAFDHVAVKAVIGGKTYWLDGTRLGDLSLDALETPNYHWMLPVQAAGAQLEALKPAPFTEAHFSARLELDASAGLDTPAKAHGEHQWRGDGAQAVRLKLEAMSATERERTMRGYWQQAEPWITPTTVSMKDDHESLTLVMDGSANMTWGADSRGRTFVIKESGVGGDVNFQRQPGPNADAPFAVDFPSFTEGSVKVTLPNKGLGFTLVNAVPIDQVVAGAQYKRTATIENGVADIELQTRSVEGEFPFSEGTAAANTLRNWGLHAVMIQSNPELADAQRDARTCDNAAPDEALKACQSLLPKIASLGGDMAAVHAQMGHLYGVKRDWADALDSFSKAIAIKPDFARALGERGAIYIEKGDLAAARADLDRALALDAKTARLWGLRGVVFTDTKDYVHAIADFDKALALAPPDYALVVARGEAYVGVGDLAHANADADRAVALDPKRPESYALKGKIFAGRKDLAQAEQAFGEAITLAPKVSAYWMDRGLVRTDLKRFADAVTDYDEALKLDPSSAAVQRYRSQAYAALGQGGKTTAGLAAGQARPLPIAPPKPLLTADLIRMYLGSGKAHSERKEYDEAIADFDQALQVVARHPDVLTERGKAYAAKRQWDLALADFDQVLKVRPNDAEVAAARAAAVDQLARANPARRATADKGGGASDVAVSVSGLMAEATEAMARMDYDGAVKDITAALKLEPRAASLLRARAAAFRAGRHYSLAVADYDGLIALDPADATLVLSRAELQALDYRWDNAIEDFTLALKLNSGLAPAYKGRGMAYEAKRQWDQAIADYDAALRLDPKDRDAQRHRAQVLAAKGSTKTAEQTSVR